ncbi:hypothetical protein ACSFCX_10220 [Yokenella regensburgei]|uniref:hypothetical protein n=1 Tax=Yokenella regensburgei TaxID=158877 RepID=UPI003EDA33CF
MWVLIFWMAVPYSAGFTDTQQPALAIHTQEFVTEKACKGAFSAIKKLNDGDLKLRGVCTPKEL